MVVCPLTYRIDSVCGLSTRSHCVFSVFLNSARRPECLYSSLRWALNHHHKGGPDDVRSSQSEVRLNHHRINLSSIDILLPAQDPRQRASNSNAWANMSEPGPSSLTVRSAASSSSSSTKNDDKTQALSKRTLAQQPDRPTAAPAGTRLIPRPAPVAPAPLPARATHNHRGARILSEEAYASSLSRLIQRDFFPDLARLRAENEYLSALEDGQDERRIQRAVAKLVRVEEELGIVAPTPRRRRGGKGKEREEEGFLGATGRTPRREDATPRTTSATPQGARGRGWDATPAASVAGDATPYAESVAESVLYDGSDDEEALGGEAMDAPSREELQGLSLGSFEQKFTSVDNASFGSLVAKVNQERRQKYAWAFIEEERAKVKWQEARTEEQRQARIGYKAMHASNEGNTKAIEGKQALAITAASSTPTEGPATALDVAIRDVGLSNAEPAAAPPADEQPAVPSQTTASGRSQTKPSWLFTARNALMFPPDADRSTLTSRTSSLKRTSSSGTEDKGDSVRARLLAQDLRDAAKAGPSINLANIRLPGIDQSDDASSSVGGRTPSSSVLNAAIDGTRRVPASSSASSIGSHDGERDDPLGLLPDEDSRPRVRGHAFVSPLPTPRPGDMGEDRMRQLMTWGSVVRTPVVLREDGTPARPPSASRGYQDDDSAESSSYGGFQLPPTPRREDLLRTMTASGRGSSRMNGSSSADSPRHSATRSSGRKKDASMLSPAAQRLLERTARTPGRSSLGSMLLGGRSGAAGESRSSLNASGSVHGMTASRGGGGAFASTTPTAPPRRDDEGQGRFKRRRWSPTPSPVPHRQV